MKMGMRQPWECTLELFDTGNQAYFFQWSREYVLYMVLAEIGHASCLWPFLMGENRCNVFVDSFIACKTKNIICIEALVILILSNIYFPLYSTLYFLTRCPNLSDALAS